MQPLTLVTVRIKAQVAARLEKLAESVDRSKSYIAAEAIEEYLDLHEWQIKAIKKGIAEVDHGELVDFDDVKQKWKRRFEDSAN